MALTQVQQGMVGTQTSIPMTYGAIGSGNSSIMKNRIINGAMVIDQRNAGASVTGNDGVYPVDRFSISASQSSKMTTQQNAGSVTPPVGFTNYTGITSSSAYAVGASEVFVLNQRIEGFNFADCQWGTANAKTVTLSFWVYSSLTGTFGGVLQNSAVNRSYPFSYSISTANTWTQVSITVAGDTTGTWIGATNGTGLIIRWSLGTGSTLSGTAGSWAGATYYSATGATSVVGTNGATFYITGVQLEVGSSATGFEYVNYQTSLANCQRYFIAYTIGQVSNSWAANSNQYLSISFPTQMRTAPSSAIISGSWTGTTPNTNYNTVNQYAWSTTAYFYGNGGLVYGFSAEL